MDATAAGGVADAERSPSSRQRKPSARETMACGVRKQVRALRMDATAAGGVADAERSPRARKPCARETMACGVRKVPA